MLKISKEKLIQLYIEENKTQSEISRIFGASPTTIHKKIKKYEIKKDINQIQKVEDFTGKKINRLTVLEMIKENWKTYWKCLCDCGNYKIVAAANLKKQFVKSCGCYRREFRSTKLTDIVTLSFFNCVKKCALERNIPFLITIEDIKEVYEKQKGKCYYTDIPINFIRNQKYRKNLQTASIDRINSNEGYTKENIQIVHKAINRFKHVLSNEEFIAFCNLVTFKHKLSLQKCKEILGEYRHGKRKFTKSKNGQT